MFLQKKSWMPRHLLLVRYLRRALRPEDDALGPHAAQPRGVQEEARLLYRQRPLCPRHCPQLHDQYHQLYTTASILFVFIFLIHMCLDCKLSEDFFYFSLLIIQISEAGYHINENNQDV